MIFVAIFGSLILGCHDAGPTKQKYPYVVTGSVTNVDFKGAVFNGEIALPGTSVVKDYGFVWNDYMSPTLDDFRISLGKDLKATFSATVSTDLVVTRNYTVRAYVETIDNVVYGSDMTFKSSGSLPPQIISFTPARGPEGTEITIVGKNFGVGKPLREKMVTLSYGNRMEIVSWSDTVIIVKAPPAFTMPKGSYQIQVTVAQMAVGSAQLFTYL